MTKEKITICPYCGEEYDIRYSRCPHCHKGNDLRPSTRVSYLPIPRQISLFAIGLAGLNVLAVILSIIFALGIKDDEPYLNLVVNSITYTTLFIADIFVVGKYYSELFFTFKKLRTYIAGFIGFAALLCSSLLIGFIMEKLVPSAGTGENQSVAIAMILRNPFVSILTLGLIGPIVEELTYRVGLFTLCKRASNILAYAVTIILFTIIHIDFFSSDIVTELVALPDYLMAAVIFSVLYHREGFGASLLAHVGNNLFSVMMIIITGGQ